MKIINNKVIKIAASVQAPSFDETKTVHTGYARLVRLITKNPVPQQTSYTGKIELR